MILITNEALVRIEKLESDKESIANLLEKLPDGYLKINHPHKGHPRYYVRYRDCETNKVVEKFISKKNNIAFAQKLATKAYYQKLLLQIEQEISCLSLFAKNYNPEAKNDLYDKLDFERKELVVPFYRTTDELAQEWDAITYVGNDKYPIGSEHETDKGEFVRSKSEQLIANYLHYNRDKVFYKYEYPLYIKSICKFFYPDFTIMNRRSGRIFYLEHCGIMDDPDYVHSMIYKHNQYIEEGLIPGVDLLYTYETSDMPFNMRTFKSLMNNVVFK